MNSMPGCQISTDFAFPGARGADVSSRDRWKDKHAHAWSGCGERGRSMLTLLWHGHQGVERIDWIGDTLGQGDESLRATSSTIWARISVGRLRSGEA